MKIAFLFPGQGCVFAGMGRDIFAEWEEVREVYEQAAYITDRDIAMLSFTASRQQLIETTNAHLAVFIHSLAVNAILRNQGIVPNFLCGHSLGQFAAITAAEVLTIEEGLRLVEHRGILLAEACKQHSGGMIAVRGCSLKEINDIIRLFPEGNICIAGFNGRDEIVVSGDLAKIKVTIRKLRECGGAVSILGVSGAFHSGAMANAAHVFAMEIEKLDFRNPKYPVVSTASGVLLESAGEIKRDLVNHMLQPIRWDLVLTTLFEQSVDCWIEIGPGKVLTGFVLRWNRGARCFYTYNSASIKKLILDIKNMEGKE